MNVLFITNNCPPLVDGVGDYTYHLAKEFVKNKHSVSIICRNRVSIKELRGVNLVPVIKKWDNSAVVPIVSYILCNKIDVVLLQYVPHGFHPKGLPLFMPYITKKIKDTGVKLFTFLHEVAVETKKGDLKRCLLSFLMQSITKRIIKNSTIVATSIDYYKDMILKLVPDKKVGIIPIASNIPVQHYAAYELTQFRDIIARKEEIIVSFFGVRDISTAIAAIANLVKKGIAIKVLLIGKTLNNSLSNLPDNIYKTGILEMKDISKYLQITDILILPEDIDSGCSFKSGSLAAALEHGLPVVSNRGKLTSKRLVHKQNIVFTDFSELDQVSATLSELIMHKECRTYISNNAKQIAIQNSWENTYQQYINFIKEP